MSTLVRIGLPIATRAFVGTLEKLGSPALMSANAFWNPRTKEFRRMHILDDIDWALDSGGFVAQRLYGGYRWTAAQYVLFAFDMQPRWWSSMDYCCEQEIAGSRGEVDRRIIATVASLLECMGHQRQINDAMESYALVEPMPVLQGRTADDYLRCAEKMQRFAFDEFPPLVGVGSVCRRHLHGEEGLVEILGHLDAQLPSHVRLHLFGVKSTALDHLRDNPRIASIDSVAWDFGERMDARKEGRPRTQESRCAALSAWSERQDVRLRVNEDRTDDLFTHSRLYDSERMIPADAFALPIPPPSSRTVRARPPV